MASSSGNDDDLTIPRAAINKMIKETLPNVRVANDARELVVNCCTEFIHLISSEANEICNKSEKKTISPEHVIQGELPEAVCFGPVRHGSFRLSAAPAPLRLFPLWFLAAT